MLPSANELSSYIGKIKKTPFRGVTVKRKDYKLAYVTLVSYTCPSPRFETCHINGVTLFQAEDQSFTFPEIFKKEKEQVDANAAAK